MQVRGCETVADCLAALHGLRDHLKQRVRRDDQARVSRQAFAAVHGFEIPEPVQGLARPHRVAFMDRRIDGAQREVAAGHAGLSAVRNADVFDRAPLNGLSSDLIAVGRRYGLLHEYLHGSGLRGCLSSLLPAGGRGGDSPGDTRARLLDEYRRLQGRIGVGVALSVQRAGSVRRGVIMDRALIDAVCIAQLPLSVLLKRCGWKNEFSYRKQLVASCDRILGAMID